MIEKSSTTSVTPTPPAVGLSTMSNAMADVDKYHAWLLSKAQPYLKNRILEIGCGYCNYTKQLADKNKNLILAIDISQECIDLCSREFSENKKVQCLRFDFLQNNLEQIKSYYCDSGFCFNVLEHVENDEQFLRNVCEVFESGASFVVIVPSGKKLYGSMDRLAGHCRRYSKKELVNKCEVSGWKVVKVEYFNFIGAIGWFITGRIIRPKSLNDDKVNKQVMFFEKYVLPVAKFFDIFFKRFFGQSLIIILKK